MEMSLWQQCICCACQDFVLLYKMTCTLRGWKNSAEKNWFSFCVAWLCPQRIPGILSMVQACILYLMAHLSLFLQPPFLCLWGDHSYTFLKLHSVTVMHKQPHQLKEAQIIWCHAPQELAALDMSAHIVTLCCTTASGGFRVLIKAILITFSQILYLQAQRFCMCTTNSRKSKQTEISGDLKLSLCWIIAEHLWLWTFCIKQGRIPNSKVQTQNWLRYKSCTVCVTTITKYVSPCFSTEMLWLFGNLFAVRFIQSRSPTYKLNAI